MVKIKKAVVLSCIILVVFACNNRKNGPQESKVTTSDTNTTTRKKIIVFFGNSLTAGYGLSPTEAFPALIQHKIDSLNLPYKVVNAGLSGETTAGGNSRINWILKQPLDVFVLELGGNDGLRGIPVTETRKNLDSIIAKVQAKYPKAKIVLAGMQIPPNMGQQFSGEFMEIYPAIAKARKLTLIPFLLDGVGGEIKLNQQDGIHPTAEGHRIVAENVWSVMKGLL